MTNLLEVMNRTKWTPKELAEAIGYKFQEFITPNTIRSYMYGKRDLSKAKFTTVRMIAFILDDIDGYYNDLERYAYMMKYITEA